MRVPKLYLETTMFNFYFAGDAPEKRQDTLKLFAEIKAGKYEPYTSQYVIRELEMASEAKRNLMMGLIREYSVKIFEADVEAERLATVYIAAGIIPEKYSTDGLHIAIATIKGIDFIVSLNFKHIVKRKTIEMTELINFREGYKKVGIYSPMEVVEDED